METNRCAAVLLGCIQQCSQHLHHVWCPAACAWCQQHTLQLTAAAAVVYWWRCHAWRPSQGTPASARHATTPARCAMTPRSSVVSADTRRPHTLPGPPAASASCITGPHQVITYPQCAQPLHLPAQTSNAFLYNTRPHSQVVAAVGTHLPPEWLARLTYGFREEQPHCCRVHPFSAA